MSRAAGSRWSPEEVRKLAEESQQAAGTIAQLISQIQEATRRTIESANTKHRAHRPGSGDRA